MAEILILRHVTNLSEETIGPFSTPFQRECTREENMLRLHFWKKPQVLIKKCLILLYLIFVYSRFNFVISAITIPTSEEASENNCRFIGRIYL